MRKAWFYQGEDVSAVPIEKRVARGMCLVPEKRELFASMTVEDNLVLGAYRRKRAGERNFLDQLEPVFALFPRLKERGSRRPERYREVNGRCWRLVAR